MFSVADVHLSVKIEGGFAYPLLSFDSLRSTDVYLLSLSDSLRSMHLRITP